MQAAIESMTGAVLADLERHEQVDATSLRFLLRRFRETDREDLRTVLEPALAVALDRHTCDESIPERAAWLLLLSEALALSADDRLVDAGRILLESLRGAWGRTVDVEAAALSVDATLRAYRPLESPAVAAAAVDELERIVAGSYRPGEELAKRIGDRSGGRADLGDHLALASALLTAFDVSGRLPYSMLAEELVQVARRVHWSTAADCFASAASAEERLRLNCEAARVCCRLAILHQDAGYRAAAVIRADAAYADDAARILLAQDVVQDGRGAPKADYGLALCDWQAMTALLSPAVS
jgi:hypothetical protein